MSWIWREQYMRVGCWNYKAIFSKTIYTVYMDKDDFYDENKFKIMVPFVTKMK